MVAPRKTRRVVCTVIEVPVSGTDRLLDDILLNELEYIDRPSNRLPWSDPTIAQLVSNLQDEVRFERRSAKLAERVTSSPVADLDPPSPYQGNNESEWEWRDQPRWTWPD
jgi:hypothetical protein